VYNRQLHPSCFLAARSPRSCCCCRLALAITDYHCLLRRALSEGLSLLCCPILHHLSDCSPRASLESPLGLALLKNPHTPQLRLSHSDSHGKPGSPTCFHRAKAALVTCAFSSIIQAQISGCSRPSSHYWPLVLIRSITHRAHQHPRPIAAARPAPQTTPTTQASKQRVACLKDRLANESECPASQLEGTFTITTAHHHAVT
jgi:hypothetical protein